jgi:ATP-dependent Lon protease
VTPVPAAVRRPRCIAEAIFCERDLRSEELSMTQDVTINSSSMPLPVELLFQHGWPPAGQLFWSRIRKIEALARDEVAADFWSGKKERSKVACQKLADLLFAAGRGEEALAALMLAADPEKPQNFENRAAAA